MSGRTRKAGVGAVAVLVMAAAAYGWVRTAEAKGERAPDVAVQLLHGGTLSLGDLRGQVVLVNFWATWCPPCRVEMPGFQRVYEARRDDGFTILIDADGRIRKTVVGAYEEQALVADVDALLREAGLEPTGEVASAPRGTPGWLELKAVGHTLGEESAPVTVVEFSDYGCAYCGRFSQETFPELYTEFVREGRVRWVHVPYVLGKFANSARATVAAYCAGEQGDASFWSMHMALFRRQAEWRSGDPLPVFRRYMEEAGGDVDAFAECYREGGPREALADADRIAGAAGVASTPTFFIDGQRVEGAAPLASFQAALREAEGE